MNQFHKAIRQKPSQLPLHRCQSLIMPHNLSPLINQLMPKVYYDIQRKNSQFNLEQKQEEMNTPNYDLNQLYNIIQESFKALHPQPTIPQIEPLCKQPQILLQRKTFQKTQSETISENIKIRVQKQKEQIIKVSDNKQFIIKKKADKGKFLLIQKIEEQDEDIINLREKLKIKNQRENYKKQIKKTKIKKDSQALYTYQYDGKQYSFIRPLEIKTTKIAKYKIVPPLLKVSQSSCTIQSHKIPQLSLHRQPEEQQCKKGYTYHDQKIFQTTLRSFEFKKGVSFDFQKKQVNMSIKNQTLMERLSRPKLNKYQGVGKIAKLKMVKNQSKGKDRMDQRYQVFEKNPEYKIYKLSKYGKFLQCS